MRFDKHGLLILCAALAVAWSGCSQLTGAAKKATGSSATADKVEKSAQEAKEKTGDGSGGSSEAPEPKPPMKKTANVPALPADAKIEPAPGARTVEAGEPDFCNGDFDEATKRTAENADSLAKMLEKELDYVQQDWAELACTFGTNENMQAWVASFKQRLVNLNGMPEWALSEHLNYHLTRSSADVSDERDAHDACEVAPREDLAIPMDVQINDMMRAFYCGGLASSHRTPAHAWFYDRKAEPAGPLERAAFVASVLGKAESFEADLGDLKGDDEQLAEFIFVRNDWVAMDDAEFKEALGQKDLDAYERWHALNQYFGAKRRGQQLAMGYEALGEQLGLFSEVTTKVPEAAFSEWSSEYDANKALVDSALEVERAWMAEDRSVLDGCHTRLRTEFSKFIKSKNPESKNDVQNLATSPIGYVALTALFRCEQENGNEHRAQALGRLVDESAKWRGPRTQALLSAYKTIAASESKRFDVDPLLPFIQSGGRGGLWSTNRNWDYQTGVGAPNYQAYANGVIAKIEEQGDLRKVSFEQTTYSYPIIKCKEVTPRVIERIKPDGSIVYREDCRVTGNKEVEETPEPVLMEPALVEGMEPGHFLRALKLETDAGKMAYPLAHYTSPDKETLISYYGILLQ
ncbi:MAG: hypothetical protein ACQEVA_19090 [Myxococcota bacterium]